MNDEDAELEGVTGFEAWHRVALHPTLAGAWLAGVDYGRAGGKVAGRAEMRDEILSLVRGTLDRDPTLQVLVARLEGMK